MPDQASVLRFAVSVCRCPGKGPWRRNCARFRQRPPLLHRDESRSGDRNPRLRLSRISNPHLTLTGGNCAGEGQRSTPSAPGLAIRIRGKVTRAKRAVLRKVDAVFLDEIRNLQCRVEFTLQGSFAVRGDNLSTVGGQVNAGRAGKGHPPDRSYRNPKLLILPTQIK
jgi:hypothetical protein